MKFETSLGRYVGYLHYILTKELNELLGEENANITADQFRLLTHLWKEDGINQQNLAACLNRDRAGVTRMIDILENQSLIKRVDDKEDRRVNRIYLTTAGKELESVATKCAQQSLDKMTTGFTEDEKKAFETLLLKAIQNLK